jgi:hypothetical protein
MRLIVAYDAELIATHAANVVPVAIGNDGEVLGDTVPTISAIARSKLDPSVIVLFILC